jgi:transposase-like protein
MRNHITNKRKKSNLRGLFALVFWLAGCILVGHLCGGIIPEAYGGLITHPPVCSVEAPTPPARQHSPRGRLRGHFHGRAAWVYAGRTFPQLGWQLWLLVVLSGVSSAVGAGDPLPGRWAALGVLALPVLRWGVAASAVAWPIWGRSWLCRKLRWGLYRLYQLTVWGLLATVAYHWTSGLLSGGPLVQGALLPLAWGGALKEAQGWQADCTTREDGTFVVTMEGPNGDCWFIPYRPVDEFDRRMFLLFLRHIRTPQCTPVWPLLRQEWLAEWFGTHQELISRWQSYQRSGDWRRLMSRRHGPLLTLDQIQQIINIWAGSFWWTIAEVTKHLQQQGYSYSRNQVEEAGQLSGFLQVRRRLRERFHLGPEAIQPQDSWLVGKLFDQLEELLEKVARGEGLTSAERLEIATVQAQRQALGLPRGTELEKALPWLYRAQQVLFGWWEDVEEGTVRCRYCDCTQVARKSSTPRYKSYYDQEGNLCQVAVYRYYCKNPVCPRKTFTNLPPGLLPHSPYPLEVHLLAFQGYAWARGAYRRVGVSLGVSTATAYRWVSAWGQELLPMAALFGVVRSSGVVGVDEKWVKVPKNDKPAGKHKQWMYVYLAVDVHTLDLLHIAIFPYLGKDSAKAFLLQLKAKGYQPQVIVTDLNRDYGEPIGQVFPQATHHECIFHAMKWIQQQIKEVYGADYKKEHPEAVTLKEQVYAIFQCQDKRTAQRRYENVMALRRAYVKATPEAASIFASLEKHWPKLLNGMGSKIIPKTNNAVELVIRRFNQHYKNFCGFESIETAQCFLAVFELVYRFTPFAKDNKKDKERPPDQRIGGKCPLELAGYPVQELPIAQIFRGRMLRWPVEAMEEVVPNV